MAGDSESASKETLELISRVGLSDDPPYEEWGKDLTLATGPRLMLGSIFCRWCGFTETPLWRPGPDGSKTLCNHCGLSFLRGERSFARRLRCALHRAALRYYNRA